MKPRQPIIGLTTYERSGEVGFSLPAEYIDAVRRAGGIPVLLPPGEPHQHELLKLLDAVVFTGGGDVDPALYQGAQHEAVYLVDPERDSSEVELAQAVVKANLPSLSICRGIQVLNVALGGTLIEHLPDVVNGEVIHRDTPEGYVQHPITIEPTSRLAEIVGQTQVNSASWHHQAIREIGSGLKAVAYAPDGTIEALEMPEHPWLIGVQWHPESAAADDPIQQRLFDALVEAAAQKARQRSNHGARQ